MQAPVRSAFHPNVVDSVCIFFPSARADSLDWAMTSSTGNYQVANTIPSNPTKRVPKIITASCMATNY